MLSQISGANEAFEQSCRDQERAGTPEFAELKRFWLGLAPSVSFGLSGVLNLTVTPELTLVWEKTDRE
jgi:hypothetical protein